MHNCNYSYSKGPLSWQAGINAALYKWELYLVWSRLHVPLNSECFLKFEEWKVARISSLWKIYVCQSRCCVCRRISLGFIGVKVHLHPSYRCGHLCKGGENAAKQYCAIFAPTLFSYDCKTDSDCDVLDDIDPFRGMFQDARGNWAKKEETQTQDSVNSFCLANDAAAIPSASSESCAETKGCLNERFSLQFLSGLKGCPALAAILRYQKHQTSLLT